MDWLYPGFFFWHSILDGFSTKCPCSDQRSPKRIQFGNRMALPPHVRANYSPITSYNQDTRLRATPQSHIPSTPCLEATHWYVESIQHPRFSPLIVGICHQGPHDSSFTEQGTKTSERWSPWSQSLGWVVFFDFHLNQCFLSICIPTSEWLQKQTVFQKKWWSL